MLKEVLEMLFGAKVISQHCLLLDFLLDRICHVTRLAKLKLSLVIRTCLLNAALNTFDTSVDVRFEVIRV